MGVMIALVLSIAWYSKFNDSISFRYSMDANDSISFKYIIIGIAC